MARFVRIWCVALPMLLAAVAGFNILVNPYDLSDNARIFGMNARKPGVRNHVALSKAYQIERARPATVVLGTSRVFIGIDAASAAWPVAMAPVYNYGIPGYIETQTLFRTLREAWATGRLKHAVIFLDFSAFLAPDGSPAWEEDDRRLLLRDDGTPNPDKIEQRAADVFLASLTIGALTDSVTTVISQRLSGDVLDLRADGTATDADFANAARSSGMRVLFAHKNAFELARMPGYLQGLASWRGQMPNLGVVQVMIQFCHTHDVGLTLVLGPSHADAMENYRAAGLWPRIEQLKFDLANLVAAAGEKGIVVWDFLEYSQYTTEPVPAADDRKTMLRWFWEPTHFRKALGDVVLERIFTENASDFGRVLTPENVGARNSQVREQQRALGEWKRAGIGEVRQ